MADGEDDGLSIGEDEGQQLQIDEDGQAGEQEPGDQGEGEQEVIFGDEAAPASGERDTGLVKHLREEIRKRDELLRTRPEPARIDLGPEPTLEGCEFDEVEFRRQTREWLAREADAKAAETADQQQARQAREEFDRDEQSYREKRARLTFADRDEVESVALSTLTKVQYASVVMAAEDSAKVLYALGKRPDKLAEISQIKNPLKLAAAVARLEGGLKVMPRRSVTAPEEVASGSAAMSIGKDKTLERLEKEAEKSGERSAVVAYKAQLKAQAKK